MLSQRRLRAWLGDFTKEFNKIEAADLKGKLFQVKSEQCLMEMFGFYMLIIGTLIWGFGDLVQLAFVQPAK